MNAAVDDGLLSYHRQTTPCLALVACLILSDKLSSVAISQALGDMPNRNCLWLAEGGKNELFPTTRLLLAQLSVVRCIVCPVDEAP